LAKLTQGKYSQCVFWMDFTHLLRGRETEKPRLPTNTWKPVLENGRSTQATDSTTQLLKICVFM